MFGGEISRGLEEFLIDCPEFRVVCLPVVSRYVELDDAADCFFIGTLFFFSFSLPLLDVFAMRR